MTYEEYCRAYGLLPNAFDSRRSYLNYRIAAKDLDAQVGPGLAVREQQYLWRNRMRPDLSVVEGEPVS